MENLDGEYAMELQSTFRLHLDTNINFKKYIQLNIIKILLNSQHKIQASKERYKIHRN